MKNWRNGVHDVSPPLQHPDMRDHFTRLRIGPLAFVIVPGPHLAPVHPDIPLAKILTP